MKRQRPSTLTSAALLQLPLFADCGRDDLDALLPHVEVVTVPADTIVGVAGRPALQFIGIVDGYASADDSGEHFVLGPGDHIGADELFTDTPFTATYSTSTTVTVLAIFGPTFRGLARGLPGVVERARHSRSADPRCGSPLRMMC